MLLAHKANMRATYHISSYKNTQPSHCERSNRSKKIPHKKFRQPETKTSQKPRRLPPHHLTLVVILESIQPPPLLQLAIAENFTVFLIVAV